MRPIATYAWMLATMALAACAGNAPTLEPAPTRVEPPPSDALVTPGPNAENELDPALFAGLPPQARACFPLTQATGRQHLSGMTQTSGKTTAR